MEALAICRSSTARLAFAILASWQASPAVAEQVHAAARAGGIEGVYALQEWHKDGQVFRPPHVDGRFVLLNGAAVYVVHSRIPDAPRSTTAAFFGAYVLGDGTFSYRYDVASTVTQTASGTTTVSRDPPWQGMRSFVVARDADTVRLRSKDGGQEFLFDARGMVYSESGKVLRVWSRVEQR